jgi:putative addiction module killer protein
MKRAVIPRKMKEYKTKEQESPFNRWLTTLKDVRAQAKITKAITQMEGGNFGDHKSITDGKGLYERRLDYGPGYRIYYITEGDELIVIFAGSDKSDQQNTINKTKDYLKDYNSRKLKEPLAPSTSKKGKRKKKKN